MSAVQVYRFSCPSCGEDIYLDAGIRDRMLEEGCVVCGEAVSAGDFTTT
jgi:predicted RNA-binding Zn-ribbon protein involved in translation (DUF1610 family)